MSIVRHAQTTVTTSATVIEGTQFPGWILNNMGADTVFLGDSGVTTSSGFPVAAGAYFSPPEIDHKSLRGLAADRLYGIAAANRDIRVLIPSGDLNA
jgi:hypothetical protein